MRTRMYGGVGGRKTKVGRKLTFVFLLPDYAILALRLMHNRRNVSLYCADNQ